MQAVAAPVGARTFYATSGRLTISMKPANKHVETGTGKVITIAGKYIEFTPMGASNHGRLVTEDEDVIAHLEKRIASGANDVFDEDGYSKLITPTDVQAKNARLALNEAQAALAEKDRVIETKNRLIEQLQRDKETKEKK